MNNNYKNVFDTLCQGQQDAHSAFYQYFEKLKEEGRKVESAPLEDWQGPLYDELAAVEETIHLNNYPDQEQKEIIDLFINGQVNQQNKKWLDFFYRDRNFAFMVLRRINEWHFLEDDLLEELPFNIDIDEIPAEQGSLDDEELTAIRDFIEGDETGAESKAVILDFPRVIEGRLADAASSFDPDGEGQGQSRRYNLFEEYIQKSDEERLLKIVIYMLRGKYYIELFSDNKAVLKLHLNVYLQEDEDTLILAGENIPVSKTRESKGSKINNSKATDYLKKQFAKSQANRKIQIILKPE